MPIGNQQALTPVVNIFTQIQPKTVLDVGVGFGTWGLLFREYSDIMHERYEKKDWQIRVDGVEVWEPYITDVHRHLYSNIYLTDLRDFEPEITYDLVNMGDVIEHFTKEEGLALLEKIKGYAQNIVVCVPVGFYNPEHDPLGNPNEHHISSWDLNDFKDWEIVSENPIIAWRKR